jgi:hypothetical protein
MNNVALRAGVVTGLYGSSGAASQQTGILGEDTARRMRVRGIPLARQPEEDAGLLVDATDAISADWQARLLNVDRRDAADVRRDVLHALDASGFRAGNPRFQGEAGDASHAITGTVRQVAAEAGARPAQVALAWVYARAGRVGVPPCPSPAQASQVAEGQRGRARHAPRCRRPRPARPSRRPSGRRPLPPRERRAHRLTRQTWPGARIQK